MKIKSSIKHILPALLAVLAFNVQTLTALGQGALTPPGAPAPTMKSLDQVQPRTPISSLPFSINAPGSYYLTGNLTGGSGTNGITISSSSVTLDLNGFTLSGVAGSTNGIYVVPVASTNITIRNGTVANWGKTGIYAPLAKSSQFVDLRVSGNGFGGIIGGVGNNFVRCVASGNQLAGLFADSGSTFQDCTASYNYGDGLELNNGGEAVNHCTFTGNSGNGFTSGGWGFVNDCTATLNGSDGFNGGRGARFVNCHSTQNSGDGFDINYGASVLNSSAIDNAGDGIKAGYRCFVRNNECYANGSGSGAGIHLTSSGNHVVGNNVSENFLGVSADVAGNFIVQNSADGNAADYNVTGTQTIGPIVSSGDITTNNPWANFSY